MMEENFNIKLRADDREIERSEKDWRTRLRQLNSEVDMFMAKYKRAALASLSMISATASAAVSIFGLFPGLVQPAFAAALQAIIATVSSLHAIAAAYAAGGVTAWLSGIVETAAIGLSIAGFAAVITGQQEASKEFRKMSSVLRSIGSASIQTQRAFSAWEGI